MRLSVFEYSDPPAQACRAFIDGVEVTNDCQIADEEEGWVRLIVRNEHGRADVNAWGELKTFRRSGKVQIRRRGEEA